MATDGRTDAGASARSVENRFAARKFTRAAGDTLNSISWIGDVDTGAHNHQVAVYTSPSPTDGTRLAVSGSQSVAVGTAQSTTILLSYEFPSSGDYYIGVSSENVGGSATVRYDAGGAANLSAYDATADNSHPPAATWGGMSSDLGTDDASISIDYTPAAGGGATPRNNLALVGMGR
jgi:hypothetical protein